MNVDYQRPTMPVPASLGTSVLGTDGQISVNHNHNSHPGVAQGPPSQSLALHASQAQPSHLESAMASTNTFTPVVEHIPGSAPVNLVIQPHPSGQSFLVVGNDTYKYKGNLKTAGGKWNRSAKAWEFGNHLMGEIQKLVDSLVNGDGAPIYEKKDDRFQTVHYKLPKPVAGMGCKITVKVVDPSGPRDEIFDCQVTLVEEHRRYIDTAYMIKIKPGPGAVYTQEDYSNQFKAVIINGRWQLWGFTQEHSIYFNIEQK